MQKKSSSTFDRLVVNHALVVALLFGNVQVDC